MRGICFLCGGPEAGRKRLVGEGFFKDTASTNWGEAISHKVRRIAFQLMNGAQTEAALGRKVLEARDNLRENRQVLRYCVRRSAAIQTAACVTCNCTETSLEDIQAGNARMLEVLDEAEEKLLTSKRKSRPSLRIRLSYGWCNRV